MNVVYTLGAVSLGALVISTVYLWHLLRELPLARRAVNLLMPASQIIFVASAFLLRPHFAAWEAVALLAAAMGVVCACLNPLFFRSLLDAERAGIEAERAALLEDQVAAQEHYALLMRRTQAEGDRMRTELDAQLAQVEAALATGDDAAALTHLAGAAEVVRTPDDRFCEHPVVDALLAAKAAWCAEEGVELDADATVPATSPPLYVYLLRSSPTRSTTPCTPAPRYRPASAGSGSARTPRRATSCWRSRTRSPRWAHRPAMRTPTGQPTTAASTQAQPRALPPKPHTPPPRRAHSPATGSASPSCARSSSGATATSPARARTASLP